MILLTYRAPHSYTGEDTIEIQGHGGTIAAQEILKIVLDAGATLAEPGEFTKRAFLNGRIDLLQAEAVIDLIRARTDRAAQAAVEQLTGKLSLAFLRLYDQTLAVAADLESTLDFSEDELPETVTKEVIRRLQTIEREFDDLQATWNEGHLLREGALVVIAGRPNAGKSTLLNALLGKSRAIVTPIAGTTRDLIEEHFVIHGYVVRIVDTAGLREASCQIEIEGIRRAWHILEQADIVIYLIDGSVEADHYDREQLARLINKSVITVMTKSDAVTTQNVTDQSVISISASRGDGMDELKARLTAQLGLDRGMVHQPVISERHRRLLISAHDEIKQAFIIMTSNTSDPALAASRLRSALEILGEVTGKQYHEALLQNIFSRFCIGK